MARTSTTEQVAAALHVKPATVRKYARANKLPFDTTPGGHRRFDVEEAVRAIAGDDDGEPAGGWELLDPVPFVRVPPASSRVTVQTVQVSPAPARVLDDAGVLEDWSTGTSVV